MTPARKIRYSMADLLAYEAKDVPYLLKPYIAERSITLMHGKSGTAKSPISWAMALHVAAGLPLWGNPVRQAPVAYIEVDQDERTAMVRASRVIRDFPSDIPFEMSFFRGNLDILQKSSVHNTLAAIQMELNPELVVLNTLRKCFTENANDSATSTRVYSAFLQLFPNAAFLFVHHDNKDLADPKMKRNEKEAFSGSGAWMNDAQVGLHTVREGEPHERKFKLVHTRSGVDEEEGGVLLRLDEHAAHLELIPQHDEVRAILTAFSAEPRAEQVKRVASLYGVGLRQAQRKIKDALGEVAS